MAERKVEIRVSVDDIDANKRLDVLAEKLKKLSDKPFTIKLKLDDGGASVMLDKIQKKLDKISKTYNPKINVDGITKADGELDDLNAKLDKIGHKRVTATVSVRTDNHTIGRDLGKLVGGGGGGLIGDAEKLAGGAAGGGGGAAGSGILSALGGANNQYFGALIATLVGLGIVTAPALLPFGIGGAVGGGALAGAGILGSKAHQKILQLQQQLAGITGNTKQARQARAGINQQIAQIQQSRGPELQTFGAFQGLGNTAVSVFNQGLTSLSQGFSGGPGGHPGTSFLTGVDAILKQIGGWLKEIGPSLGLLFRASLPFIDAFAKIMEKTGKALIPAFTQSLRALTPFIPLLVQGFMILVKEGLVPMIKNLGPGMKDASIIFKAVMEVVAAILRGVGSAATGFAILFVDVARGVEKGAHLIEHLFDELRHNAPSYFTQMGHDIEHIWDTIWNNTVGRLERGIQDMYHLDDQLRHSIANTFDTIRHDIASAWDTIWSDTKRVVSSGVNSVVSFFAKLPGRVLGALRGLGHSLYAFGHAALTELWDGIKSVGGSILSWLGNFVKSIPSMIMHLLHMSPPHPGSVFFDLGANFMHHLESGMKSRASKINVGGMVHPTGSGGSVEALMKSMAASIGWTGAMWNALYNVEMREAGFRLDARNSSSGAYGLAQFINGPSEYYQYGGNPDTAAGQITGMLNYIRQRYGNPMAAWAHEMNFGWYDKGGKLPPGLSLALNTTGHDEIHTSGPVGGNVYININGAIDTDNTARQVLKVLKRYQARHGGVALNLA